MIPNEILGWRDLIGQRFKTRRLGWLRFRDRDYKRAGSIQIPWPPGILKRVDRDVPEVGHPLTLECLHRAWHLMAERVRNYACKTGQLYTLGRIIVNSCYRPPGETCGSGEFRDPHGVADTTDNYGHWHMSVDISLEQTRLSFTPNLKRSSVIRCLRKAGLIQPISCEWWHWRPKRKVRKKYYKEYPEENLYG